MGEKLNKVKRCNIQLGLCIAILMFIFFFACYLMLRVPEEQSWRNVAVDDDQEMYTNSQDGSKAASEIDELVVQSRSLYSEILRITKLMDFFSRKEKIYLDTLNTKVESLVRSSHDTGTYVHSNRGQILCGLRTNKVLIMVMSNYYNIMERDTIRETWGREMKYLESQYGRHELQWKRVFIVSIADENFEKENLLQMELNMRPDILQIDIEEGRAKRGLKLYATLQWALNNCNFEYLLITPSENFVNLRALYEFLHFRNKPKKHLYGGIAETREVKIPKLPLHDYKGQTVSKELTYIADNAFILSRDVVQTSLRTMMMYSQVPSINPAIMLGLAMDHLNIKPFHLRNFQTVASCKFHLSYILLYEANPRCFNPMYKEYLTFKRLNRN